jgi:hypothetical protein
MDTYIRIPRNIPYLLDVTGAGLAAELRYLGRLQLLSDIF